MMPEKQETNEAKEPRWRIALDSFSESVYGKIVLGAVVAASIGFGMYSSVSNQVQKPKICIEQISNEEVKELADYQNQTLKIAYALGAVKFIDASCKIDEHSSDEMCKDLEKLMKDIDLWSDTLEKKIKKSNLSPNLKDEQIKILYDMKNPNYFKPDPACCD